MEPIRLVAVDGIQWGWAAGGVEVRSWTVVLWNLLLTVHVGLQVVAFN